MMYHFQTHQYIERRTSRVIDEIPVADQIVSVIYSLVRENAPFAFRLLLSQRITAVLGFLNYDVPFLKSVSDPRRLFRQLNIKTEELFDPPSFYTSYRKVFERRIAYWKYRPMNPEPGNIASPADARMLIGSFRRDKTIFVKEKLFNYQELISADRPEWSEALKNGDFAVFRLTPDKYHYNHSPVSGRVADIYEINGCFHSCNPGAVVQSVTPYSKNRRVITIIDTDVPGGSRVGLVAMIEIVALMIGRIEQRYSRHRYQDPTHVIPGTFLKKGCPKSLFQPGSSTVVLIFQPKRITFCPDLLENTRRTDVKSRFSCGLGRSAVETEIFVRETIGATT